MWTDLRRKLTNRDGCLFQYVMISIRHGVPMSMGGSEEPTAYAELISIGGLTPPNNKKISAAISEILEKKASIDPGRFYLKFTDVKVILRCSVLLVSRVVFDYCSLVCLIIIFSVLRGCLDGLFTGSPRITIQIVHSITCRQNMSEHSYKSHENIQTYPLFISTIIVY